MKLMIIEEMTILENRLQSYKNNYGIAVKNKSRNRQTKYTNLTTDIKEQIKQLERNITPEDNERLREIIKKQNKKLAIQREVRNKQGEKLKELEGVIKTWK